MSEHLISIGIFIILIGFALVIIGSLLTTFKSKQVKAESGGVILIGPFPIVWGSNKNMVVLAVTITVIFLLLFLLLNLLGR
jgi:uncharacterized protein (TIGR00304 family)